MEVNPYESPQTSPEPAAGPKPWLVTYLAFIATGTLLCILVGMGENAFHGSYNPDYFRIVMNWEADDGDIWVKSIFQGGLEGIVMGVVLSGFFIAVAWRITQGRITYAQAARHLPFIALGAVMVGFFAGVVAVNLVADYPDLASLLFPLAPKSLDGLFRFALVGANITGLQLSAVVFAIIHLYLVYRRDRRQLAKESAAAKTSLAD